MVDAARCDEKTMPAAARLPAYVLVTPARNEARFIASAIESVVAQTALPLRWAIVSDGSTDGTDAIVSRYAAQHEWIELVRMPERAERNFAGKALAARAGEERMQGLEYEVIVSLDADITFQPDYFEFLLGKLAADARLGVVGTPYKDVSNEVYDYRFVSTDHVSGACQMFRRACWEEIGGYVLSKGGAIDTIATLTARSKGWKTRTFTEKMGLHHRVIGTAQNGMLKSRFILGKRDWMIGNSTVWEVCRGLYQMTKRPYVLRGMAIVTGYFWAACTGVDRAVPAELRAFRRKEQMAFLRRFVRRETGEARSAHTQAAG
ncbi:MAG TPA: glycosyltransferase family A protein [Terracidiphilus sp.]|jgi:glycosyltransferase involved in cell wall biosynthesis|nr:glycosyltransferase family A protein [Terracidiphilus sp.]